MINGKLINIIILLLLYTDVFSKTCVPTVNRNELSFGYATLTTEHM